MHFDSQRNMQRKTYFLNVVSEIKGIKKGDHSFYVEFCFEGVARNGGRLLVACEGWKSSLMICISFNMELNSAFKFNDTV